MTRLGKALDTVKAHIAGARDGASRGEQPEIFSAEMRAGVQIGALVQMASRRSCHARMRSRPAWPEIRSNSGS